MEVLPSEMACDTNCPIKSSLRLPRLRTQTKQQRRIPSKWFKQNERQQRTMSCLLQTSQWFPFSYLGNYSQFAAGAKTTADLMEHCSDPSSNSKCGSHSVQILCNKNKLLWIRKQRCTFHLVPEGSPTRRLRWLSEKANTERTASNVNFKSTIDVIL